MLFWFFYFVVSSGKNLHGYSKCFGMVLRKLHKRYLVVVKSILERFHPCCHFVYCSWAQCPQSIFVFLSVHRFFCSFTSVPGTVGCMFISLFHSVYCFKNSSHVLGLIVFVPARWIDSEYSIRALSVCIMFFHSAQKPTDCAMSYSLV